MEDETPIYQLKEEARNGNIYATYRLARIYLNPDDRRYNVNLGNYYLEKAANYNHAEAQYRMGKMF